MFMMQFIFVKKQGKEGLYVGNLSVKYSVTTIGSAKGRLPLLSQKYAIKMSLIHRKD
jgi:hypothetical protein